MNFSHAIMRPGTVLEVLDNKGTLKAAVPGMFHKDDIENLPPVRPFPSTSANNFSAPNEGEEIWVLFFTDNPEELRWFRKEDVTNDAEFNKTISSDPEEYSEGVPIQDLENVEIISNRATKMGCATIYFSDGTGWVIQNQMVAAKITDEGIILTTGMPHGIIDINQDGISIGSLGQSEHPACYGDKAAELFDKVINTLNKVAEIAKGNPYTKAIGIMLEQELDKFEEDSQYISSDYVTID